MHILKSTIALFCMLSSVAACGADEGVTLYEYEIVNTYPHDRNAFTQGLFFRDGALFESTGLNGSSSIREVVLETGEVLRKHDLSAEYFGEGIVDWDDRLIHVTWKSGKGFVYGLDDFKRQKLFRVKGEGWGLTKNDSHIIMSDGTDKLRFLDPESLKEVSRLTVTLNGQGVRNLNELEWIEGEIYSNVWQTDWILRINPESGLVTGLIDMSGLLPASARTPGKASVLNGIAYDSANQRIFVTGKNWPRLFEIRLAEKVAE